MVRALSDGYFLCRCIVVKRLLLAGPKHGMVKPENYQISEWGPCNIVWNIFLTIMFHICSFHENEGSVWIPFIGGIPLSAGKNLPRASSSGIKMDKHINHPHHSCSTACLFQKGTLAVVLISQWKGNCENWVTHSSKVAKVFVGRTVCPY